jgi:hypothetical protein
MACARPELTLASRSLIKVGAAALDSIWPIARLRTYKFPAGTRLMKFNLIVLYRGQEYARDLERRADFEIAR